MKTTVVRTFDITITCDEEQAKVICDAIHSAYKPLKEERGYGDSDVETLKAVRDAFANAIQRFYMGDDI